jgi:hypothetical protein
LTTVIRSSSAEIMANPIRFLDNIPSGCAALVEVDEEGADIGLASLGSAMPIRALAAR